MSKEQNKNIKNSSTTSDNTQTLIVPTHITGKKKEEQKAANFMMNFLKSASTFAPLNKQNKVLIILLNSNVYFKLYDTKFMSLIINIFGIYF